MTDGLGSLWFIGPFPHIAAVEPGGPFGGVSAIQPHFDILAPAEQAAAVNLMLERGDGLGEIADGLGLSRTAIKAISVRRCQPISPFGGSDDVKRMPGSGPKRGAASQVVFDRALDDTLMAIEALRARAGAGRDVAFDLTLEEVCQACGFGLVTARRRFRELESRKWVCRELPPGRPARVMISPSGRGRLGALSGGRTRAEP